MSAEPIRIALQAGIEEGAPYRGHAYTITERRLRVRAGEGFDIVLLPGRAGIGKTTLLTSIMRGGMFDAPARYLHRPPDDVGEFRALLSGPAAPRILVVDDADQLSVEMVEIAAGFSCGAEIPKLQLVLACLPASVARFVADAKALGIGIASSSLGGLDDDEIPLFVAHRFAAAGRNRNLFTAEALGKIAVCTEGVPRLVTLLCEKSLEAARAQGEHQIVASIVDETAAAMGLTPAPPPLIDKLLEILPLDGFFPLQA